MKKRYTDADKWDKKWFRKLSNQAKLLWIFLLDTCDYAGIWEEDMEKIKFCLGDIINYENIKDELKKQIYHLGDEKYIIIDFIKFQYKKLKKDNPVHQKVIDRLKEIGLEKLKNIPELINLINHINNDEDTISPKLLKYKNNLFNCPDCNKLISKEELYTHKCNDIKPLSENIKKQILKIINNEEKKNIE